MARSLLGLCTAALAALAPAGAADAPVARTLKLPETPYKYADADLPAHFKARAVRDIDNTPRDNQITDAGAALGRVLFYDTRLSANGTVACGSCHHQKHAFSDPGAKFSKGFEGKLTDRNAMPLTEARYYGRGRFFWDERARTLEDQVLMPIQNKVEMGHTLPKVLDAIGAAPEYADLYKKAFGDAKVTRDRTARAQFVRALSSYRSKYDEGVAQVRSRNDEFPNFSREENRGRGLFMQRCAQCHMPNNQDAVFTSPNPQNNGVDADIAVPDLGLADVNFDRGRAGQFKSPSLRNVELTAPYMHDGRFAKLEDVIEHYSSGVKSHPNLDGRLRNLGAGPGGPRGPGDGAPRGRGFQFSSGDKAALLAFLKTLTDHKFITDPRFSDPFVAAK